MFRIFDDVKIISTTPPAIYVDYYFCSRKTKAKKGAVGLVLTFKVSAICFGGIVHF